MKHHFSSRVSGAKRSAIRELLKLTEKPDIISFGGGLPAPETFPHNELADIAEDLLRNDYKNVLQYGVTEGSRTLRKAMMEWLRPQGVEATIDELLVTTASQQALDLLCKAFFDPGEVVFCGLPTYLGAVQAFRLFQVDTVGIPLEDDGMDLDILEERIAETKTAGKRMKGIYVIPDFQNPSGITMSLKKRKRLLAIAQREDLLIFEDDPYGKLRFAGDHIPSICSLDEEGRVILMLTFSKTLSSGLRLAVMLARGDLMDALVRAKQPTDLCTSKLTQHMAARYMNEHGLDKHLDEIRPIYREKCTAMLDALERHMPKGEGISWTKPQGGLFVWMRLPEDIDTQKMLDLAIEKKVAYVPGAAAFVDGGGHNTMRLAYSLATPDVIEEGIQRLADVIRETIEAKRISAGVT